VQAPFGTLHLVRGEGEWLIETPVRTLGRDR